MKWYNVMKKLLIVVVLMLSACDDAPVVQYGPDGMTRNGFEINEYGDYVEPR